MKAEEIGPSLLAAFARVPDGRSRHGRRYPVPALLRLATAAMRCGARSVYAIAQWGRLQPAEVRRAVGFTPATPGRGMAMPAATTRHYAFKRLEVVGFEAALQAWAVAALAPTDRPLVLDGKALRGIHGEELPGIRLVAVYAPEAGLVLAQAGGEDPRGADADGEERAQAQQAAENRRRKTGGGKQEAALSVAPRWRRGGATVAPRLVLLR